MRRTRKLLPSGNLDCCFKIITSSRIMPFFVKPMLQTGMDSTFYWRYRVEVHAGTRQARQVGQVIAFIRLAYLVRKTVGFSSTLN